MGTATSGVVVLERERGRDSEGQAETRCEEMTERQTVIDLRKRKR